MSRDVLLLLTPLRQALERIERKPQPQLKNPMLLQEEEGQDKLKPVEGDCVQLDQYIEFMANMASDKASIV
jgi:hypothetical protein